MSNIPAVQAIYEAFGKGDIPAILDRLADDVEWDRGMDHGVPYLKPGKGKAHVQNFFQQLAAFQIAKFQPKNLLEGGNQVVAVIDIEGTVTATNTTITDEELHLWTFGADGKVTEFRHLVDTAQHVAAMKGAAVPA